MNPRLKKSLLRLLVVLIAVPLLAWSYMWYNQESFLFHERRTLASDRFTSPHPFEEIWVELDGLKLHSVFFNNPDSKTLILYFHGNAGTMSSTWGRVADDLSHKLGVSVWMMDFPGFGLSEGHITSETQLMRMAKIFFDKIPERGDFDQILVYGRSMGTGIAAQLAAREGPEKIAGLVLEAPFSSLTALVKERQAWIPSFLLRYRFETEQALSLYPGPVLIFHGDQDEVIPVHHARRLAAARGPDQVIYKEVPGGTHDSMRTLDLYWTEMAAFVPYTRAVAGRDDGAPPAGVGP